MLAHFNRRQRRVLAFEFAKLENAVGRRFVVLPHLFGNVDNFIAHTRVFYKRSPLFRMVKGVFGSGILWRRIAA